MGDPVLGLKYALVCACVIIVLYLAYLIARGIRYVSNTRWIASNAEVILLMMILVFMVATALCLLWSAVAWII